MASNVMAWHSCLLSIHSVSAIVPWGQGTIELPICFRIYSGMLCEPGTMLPAVRPDQALRRRLGKA